MDLEEARAALEESAEFHSHKARRERIATACLAGLMAGDSGPYLSNNPSIAVRTALEVTGALIAALDAPVSP